MNQIPSVGKFCEGCPCIEWLGALDKHWCSLFDNKLKVSIEKLIRLPECLEQQPQILSGEDIQNTIRDATGALQRDKDFLLKSINEQAMKFVVRVDKAIRKIEMFQETGEEAYLKKAISTLEGGA